MKNVRIGVLNERPAHPERVFRSLDVAFIAPMHIRESKEIRRLLEKFGVPYIGSGILASALGANKALAKEAFTRAGLNTPKGIVIDLADLEVRLPSGLGVELLSEAANKIFKAMGPSWAIKPLSSGFSLGVSVAHNFGELVEAIKIASAFDLKILAEEYIKGGAATCGVIENFRGQKYYSLPVLENFNLKTKKEIEEKAVTAHRALGSRHYSEFNFIVSSKKIYILEADTSPALAEESFFPRALEAVGSSRSEFLKHLINHALKN
jgi:D-alanine-D-alanine ligase